MLTIVFLETSLELIPKEISKHPVIVKDAKRRGKIPARIILDDSKHHSAMKKLKNRRKRGRPDIIHHCLLSLLDSRISDMEIYVHTINDKIFWINRKTRLPRNYNRFIGLMESLFERGVIKASGEVLVKVADTSLSNLISSFSKSSVVLLIERGDKDEECFRRLLRKNSLVVCIGAFPHGDFSENILHLMKNVNANFVSFGNEALTSLYVTNRVVCLYENERIQAD